MAIKVGDRLPEGTLTELIEEERRGLLRRAPTRSRCRTSPRASAS